MCQCNVNRGFIYGYESTSIWNIKEASLLYFYKSFKMPSHTMLIKYHLRFPTNISPYFKNKCNLALTPPNQNTSSRRLNCVIILLTKIINLLIIRQRTKIVWQSCFKQWLNGFFRLTAEKKCKDKSVSENPMRNVVVGGQLR